MSWDELQQASPCSHVFASAGYLELIGRTFRGHVQEDVVTEDGRSVAAARLLSRRSPLTFRAVVPPYTPYSALLLDRMPTEAETHHRTANLEHILVELENRYSGADIHLPPKLVDVRTFSWRKWAVRPLYTYRVDLREAGLDKKWSDSTRRIVRRAADEYELVDPGADRVAGLSVASYARSGRKTPLSKKRLAAFIESSVAEVGAELFGARNTQSGEVEAAVAVLRDEKNAYYWIAGGASGDGMTVLLSSLFHRLADERIENFDFVGANTDTIAEFKRRFGGLLTTYFRATWRSGPLTTVEDALLRLR